MDNQLKNRLVVGVSARALFDMDVENKIFESGGPEAYRAYQVAHEREILKPGPGFSLVKALLSLNRLPGQEGRVEVIVMSRSGPDASLRIFNSVAYYGLGITRALMAGGASMAPYLDAFRPDLFLSACEADVQHAVDAGLAAGIVCTGAGSAAREDGTARIKIAFDGDAVLFADESERIFREKGLAAFELNEREFAREPLREGPFARLLKTIDRIQREFAPQPGPFRTALVTARCAPAHERVIRTLRAWGVGIDEAFFLGGLEKKDVLRAFGAHIFFDDQTVHTAAAEGVVPAARVPARRTAG